MEAAARRQAKQEALEAAQAGVTVGTVQNIATTEEVIAVSEHNNSVVPGVVRGKRRRNEVNYVELEKELQRRKEEHSA